MATQTVERGNEMSDFQMEMLVGAWAVIGLLISLNVHVARIAAIMENKLGPTKGAAE
jgi:hypothetical protein